MQPASTLISAFLWMSAALTSFSILAVGARELASELETFQILFYRGLVALCILFPIILVTNRRRFFTIQPGTHLLRHTAHFVGQAAWFYALGIIPLAEVFAIEFTVPVWTAIMAALIMGERLHGHRVIAVIAGLCGMLIILRPGIEIIQPAALILLAGTLCYGLAHTLTRKLSFKDNALTILFYMTVMQLPMSFFLADTNWEMPSLQAIPWIMLIGFTGLSAHYCMTRALAVADVTIVIPIDFLRLPLIAIVGYLLYQETVDSFLVIGAALMFAGNIYSLKQEQKRINAARSQNSS